MKRVKRPRSAGPRALERTIARSLAFLRAHPVESVQAGLAAFLPASGGASRDRFLSNLVATESPEGHWHHSLADTAWNLRLLHDLGEHRTPGVYRAVEWIFSTQGQPGAYARGCSEASHRDRICEHFFGPCFSPGEAQLSSARFPNGAEIASDAGARFLISNVALEALLRWGYDRDPRLERYLESLRNFPRLFSRYGGMFAPVLMVSVLAVLLRDRHPRSKKQAGNLLRLLAKLQKRDGNWPHLDRFYVLDVIGHSRNRHARRMLARSRPRLLALARRDGSWGNSALATGIALRALAALSKLGGRHSSASARL